MPPRLALMRPDAAPGFAHIAAAMNTFETLETRKTFEARKTFAAYAAYAAYAICGAAACGCRRAGMCHAGRLLHRDAAVTGVNADSEARTG